MAKLVFSFIISLYMGFSTPFNIDVSDPSVHYAGKDGYFFGYALTLHRNKARGEKWMMVGAPRGNDTARGLKPLWGAVYKCNLENPGSQCEVMKDFDDTDISRIVVGDNSFEKDYKEGQWFGGTVYSAGETVLACAPRYVLKGDQGRDHYNAGRCELHNLQDPKKNTYWEPCSLSSIKKYDHCETGISGTLSASGNDVLVGAAGVGSFQGRLIRTPYPDQIETTFSSVVEEIQSNDYFGYAVAVGPFASDKSLVYVGGAPRSEKGVGKVVLFKTIGPGVKSLADVVSPVQQVGSYFGSALLALDFNNDGFSDLLVGAPYHSWNYNEGAMFAFINDKGTLKALYTKAINGDQKVGAQFGKAMAKADLNADGYEDAIVGAPYEDDGKGAIYLYYGSASGLLFEYRQKITPSILGKGLGAPLKTFGLGVGTGADIDDNKYPDIAVGSFMSDRAVFLRTRPVITIKCEIELSVDKITFSKTSTTCPGQDGKQYPCFKANIFFQYEDDTLSFAAVEYTLKIDSERDNEKRGFTFKDGNKVTGLSNVKTVLKGTRVSDEFIIFLTNDTRDIFNPLVLSVTFNYREPNPCNLCSVMNVFVPKETKKEIPFVKGCGNDDICSSDLVVTAKAMIQGGGNTIAVGVVNSFSIDVSVENKGENAFSTYLAVNMSYEISIIVVEAKLGINPIWETKAVSPTTNQLSFQVANPMSQGQKADFTIKLNVNEGKATSRTVPFDFEVTTLSREMRPADNRASLNLALLVEADMTISGVVVPAQVVYSESVLSEKVIGPRVVHTLLVQNKGPSLAVRSQVDIEFPNRISNSYFLNIHKLTFEGPGSCDLSQSAINPLKLPPLDQTSGNGSNVINRKKRAISRIACGGKDLGCEKFQCNIGQLGKGATVVITLVSTVVESTFNKIFKDSQEVAMRAVVNPIKTQQPSQNNLPDAVELVLTVNSPAPITQKSTSSVPWWVILLSVLAGVILIAGAVFILYRRGFFNRKKHTQVPTQEDEDL